MATTVEAPPQSRRAEPQDAALRHALRDLYDEVADLLDDDRVESFPDYFVDDCTYRVTTRENFDQDLLSLHRQELIIIW